MRSRLSDKTGTAIRKLRLARGWNLATLSEKSGVPISTLSRVELGQNALNYDKLMRLCRALEVDLEGLVTREASSAPIASGRRSVDRKGQGRAVRIGGHAAVQMAGDLIGRRMTPSVVDVTGGGQPDVQAFVAHGGEVFLMVLAGAIEVHSPLYAPLSLALGDSVYFDASSGFALTTPKGRAQVLIVCDGESLSGQ